MNDQQVLTLILRGYTLEELIKETGYREEVICAKLWNLCLHSGFGGIHGFVENLGHLKKNKESRVEELIRNYNKSPLLLDVNVAYLDINEIKVLSSKHDLYIFEWTIRKIFVMDVNKDEWVRELVREGVITFVNSRNEEIRLKRFYPNTSTYSVTFVKTSIQLMQTVWGRSEWIKGCIFTENAEILALAESENIMTVTL